MRNSTDHGSSVAVRVHRSRMRAFVQIIGGVVLGLGLAAAVGLDPGPLFAAYTVGMGLTLLCLGLLLPEDPDAPPHTRHHTPPPCACAADLPRTPPTTRTS